MRKQYAQILKAFFCENISRERYALGLSQEEMEGRLSMVWRTYIDLEHGKTGCSAVTLSLFLLYICTDPTLFLEQLRHAFEATDNEAA